MHSDEEYRLSARAAALGVVMAAPPGEREPSEAEAS